MTDSPQAVFLSYSSADEAAAVRLCEGLRAAGIETWFDRNELRGGDAWDANIRRQIRDCALFVPMISASTEARSEGYFRLEWRLAVERSFHFADDRAFLMPVVIDATRQATARVPDRFRERQWTSLPQGAPTAEFIAHVQRLLAGAKLPAAAPDAVPGPRAGGRRMRLVAGLVAAGALAALAFAWWHRGPATGAAGTLAAVDRKSIAVLPFENLTGHADDAYLADGLQEEILNALARVRDFKVISRTSVAAYRGAQHNVREISERLGVGTVLEGSLRREANTLRLTIQLINAKADVHLLATNYDRDLGHILGLQSEVAHAVADTLAGTLNRAERGELDHIGTNNGDAYVSYLKAVALFQNWDPGDVATATEPEKLLESAIQLDPDFADVYALQSRMYSLMYMRAENAEDGKRARAAFERALAIDPQLVEARLARGLYELYVARDPDRALADLEPLAALRPNSPFALQGLALVLRRRGRMDEALALFQRAWDIDPLNHIYDRAVLSTCQGLRRFPEVLDWTRLHLVRFPDIDDPRFIAARVNAFTTHSLEPLKALLQRSDLDPEWRRSFAAQVAVAEGRYQDAIASWQARTGMDAQERLEAAAYLYRAAGDSAASEQRFRTLEHDLVATLKSSPGNRDEFLKSLALAQSALGEHDAAIATIEEARARVPESLDHVNGPSISFVRSVVLARAGRTAEAYAEVTRLLHVPFGSPWEVGDSPWVYLLLKDDPHFDELLNRPPRL